MCVRPRLEMATSCFDISSSVVNHKTIVLIFTLGKIETPMQACCA
jgi:hypothetical protein